MAGWHLHQAAGRNLLVSTDRQQADACQLETIGRAPVSSLQVTYELKWTGLQSTISRDKR